MATCKYALSGITLQCESNRGGLRAIYIANYSEDLLADFRARVASGDTAATQIAATALTAATVEWHKYEFKRNTASFSQSLQVGDQNAGNYVTTDIVMQFGRMDTTKRIEMRALTLNEVMVVAVDSNGTAWLFGLDEPVVASDASGVSGTQKSDANMYELHLQANDDSFAFEVTGDLSVLTA